MLKRSIATVASIASLTMLSTGAHAQLPTPSKGWNLGNTLESTWGGPAPTQALINSVAAQGFNTVRIPCAWNYNSTNGTINSSYMTTVTNVVNWCTAKGLYVVLNDHWDNNFFQGNSFASYDSNLNSAYMNMWTQVANNFKNYDGHVLFACTNEPQATSQAATNVMFQYYRNWVTTIRNTGGNNSTRWLVLQGPQTSIDNTCSWVSSSIWPNDPASHLMIEVHWYDPFQFTQLSPDASWGNMFYFWGSQYHVTSGPTSRNATWGEESTIDAEFAKMKSQWVNAGIPVLIGEFQAHAKPSESDLTGQYITQNYNSATYWNYYVQTKANANGLYSAYWTIPGQDFDWTTGNVVDQNLVNAALGKSYLPSVFGSANPTFTATASASPSTIAPGATGTITASFTDTGAAASNLVTDIEVYNSAGAKVSQQTYSGQNFTAGGANTYNWSWTAPATAGTYTVSLGVFKSDWSASYYWGSNAATITVAGDGAQYNFESGTQSWASSGGMIGTLSSSTTKAFAGTHSLAVPITSTGSGSTQSVSIGSPSTAAGKVVTFHIWIPSGSKISAIQPYVQQGSGGNWTWTGNYQTIGNLTANAWNTLTVTVPSNAVTPLASLGVQFSTNGAWTGACYVDSVSW